MTSLLCLGIFAAYNLSYKAEASGLSYSHLAINLLILFLIGCLVEFRRSSWILLGVYVLGASFGYWLHASPELSESQRPLIANSVGLVAVGGLFAAYFYRLRMKYLLIALPPFYRSFHATSIVVLPMILLVEAIIHSVSIGQLPLSLLMGCLAASAVGIGIGLWVENRNPIAWPYLYGFEAASLKKIHSESSPHERIYHAQELLCINPENMLAAELVCRNLLHLMGRGFPMTPESRDLLRNYIPTLMSVYTRRREPEKAFALLPLIPRQIEFAEILDRSSQPVIAMGMQWALLANEHNTLLRLYEVAAERFSLQKQEFALRQLHKRSLDALKSREEGQKIDEQDAA